MSDRYKKILDGKAGPGGVSCPCCGETTPKGKRIANKQAKQILKRELDKEVDAAIVCEFCGSAKDVSYQTIPATFMSTNTITKFVCSDCYCKKAEDMLALRHV